MYKKKKSGVIGIVLTIIVLVILAVISNINVSNFKYVENGLSVLVTPIQNGMTYLKNKIAKNNTFFSDINNLKSENEELKKSNSELEQKLREFEVIQTENKGLREKVNLTEQYGEYRTKPANVINKDFNNFSNTIIIDIGEKEGIKPEMAVISDKRFGGSCYFSYRKYC